MNPNNLDDEPLKLHELVVATSIVVTACIGVAVSFTALAMGQFVGDTFKRIRKKGDHHVP